MQTSTLCFALLALVLQSEPKRVAVLEFTDDGGKATEAITAALLKRQGVTAVDAEKVRALLAESKERDPVALGKLLGVDLVVTGKLVAVRTGQESVLGETKEWEEVALDARVISVATGELVAQSAVVARGAPGEGFKAVAAKAVESLFAARKPTGRPRAGVAEGERPRLCIVDIVDKSGMSLTREATDVVSSALAGPQQFRILDRAAMQKVLDELKNAQVADPVAAARLGKLLAAKAVVYGTVTEAGVRVEVKNGKKQWVASVVVALRVLDVDSSEVLYSDSLTGSAATDKMDLKAVTGAALRSAIELNLDSVVDAVIPAACVLCKKRTGAAAELCVTCGACKGCCTCGR